MSLRAKFLAFDDALSARGIPPLTAWWREGIGRWLDTYESGGPLELWACAGRGSAKSTAGYKLALFFTLFVDFVIPPGERHFAIGLSRLKEEAAKAIQIIASWLQLLAVPHSVAGDVIELADLPRGIRVVAASVPGSSGWRVFFVFKDERSKWPWGGVDDLDASEIDTSAAAMTATHPRAPILAFGSAWGAHGPFFDAIAGGTTATRVVLGPAPTWEAAPHISKESLLRKEPDPKRFAREYECVFQSGATSALDPELVRAAVRPFRRGYPLSAPVLGFDASQGKGDATAWCACQWWQPTIEEADFFEYVDTIEHGIPLRIQTLDANGNRKRKATAPAPPRPELVVYNIESIAGRFADRGVTNDEVIAEVAAAARRVGARHILSDSLASYQNASAFASHGLALIASAWTNENKSEAILRLRTLLRDSSIAIEHTAGGKQLAQELIGLQETIRPSGAIGIGARRGHDDMAASVISVLIAESQGFVAGSPIQERRGIWVHGPGHEGVYHGRAA